MKGVHVGAVAESAAGGAAGFTRRRSQWYGALVIYSLLLLLPLISVTIIGSTFTGLYEESLGYRYFYSLRALHEPDEFLFLAQGHLVTLVHQPLQWVLDLVFPTTQLLPRIDVFARIAVLVAHGVTIAAFSWAIRPKFFDRARLAFALVWGSLYYINAWGSGYVLLSPDYHPWIPAVGLLFVGLTARIIEERSAIPSSRYWQLGLIGGLALSVKISMGIYGFVLGLLMLSIEKRPVRGLTLISLAAITSFLLAATILVLSLGGRMGHLWEHFSALSNFLNSAVSDHLYRLTETQFDQLLTISGDWKGLLLFIAPILLLGLFIASRDAVQSTFLLLAILGATIYAYILYQRYTDITQFEAAVFMFYVLSIIVSPAWSVSIFPQRLIVFGVIGGLAVLLGKQLFWDQQFIVFRLIKNMALNSIVQEKLRCLTNNSREPLAFLIPGNEYRLVSLDTLLYKGATKVFDDGIRSGLMRTIMGRRTYLMDSESTYAAAPPELLKFGNIVFSILQSPNNNYLDYYIRAIPSRIQEIERYYNTSLDAYDCDNWVDFGEEISPRLAVVCRQRTVPASEVQVVPWRMNGSGRWSSAARALHVKIGALSSKTTAGRSARIIGQPGDQLWLSGVGPWSVERQGFAGLAATSIDGSWYVDLSNWSPSNQNPRLNGGAASGLPGFWVSPGDAEPQLQWLKDEGGPFVRVIATKPSSYLVLNGQLQPGNIDNVPVSVVATARTSPRKELRLAVHDVVAPDGKHQSRVLTLKPEDHEWVTGVVRLGVASYVNPGDNFAVGIGNVIPGDYFDVRFIGLYVGIVP